MSERRRPPALYITSTGRISSRIYNAIDNESERAHAKHGETSMLGDSSDDRDRLAILMEELGEVARVLNEHRHAGRPSTAITHCGADDLLYEELIQCGAMCAGWAAKVAERLDAPLSSDVEGGQHE